MNTRVLWLTKGLGRGGAEMLLVALARAMDRSELSIDVGFRLPHKTALVEPLESLGLRTFSLGAGNRHWTRELRHVLEAGDYDVIHTHAPLIGSAARVLAPRRTHVVHTEHNTWSRYHPATRLMNQATLGRNERVWAVSDEVARSIRPWGRRPLVSVLLHGIDPASVRKGQTARAQARRTLGLPEEVFVFGTVGNLAPKKDQRTLLNAFALATQSGPRSQLVVIGTGPEEIALKAHARSLRIDDRVCFLGMRDDVPELLPGFDAFTLSSRHEGLSIAVIEAMAAGVPVLSTRVGGISQLVGESDGLLVPAADPHALADAMDRLRCDDDLRQALSAAGPRRAAAFDIQRAADFLVREYHRLARDSEVTA